MTGSESSASDLKYWLKDNNINPQSATALADSFDSRAELLDAQRPELVAIDGVGQTTADDVLELSSDDSSVEADDSVIDTDGVSDDTYDPTDEFRDDRDTQATLDVGEESARTSHREGKIAAGSDQFRDDRGDADIDDHVQTGLGIESEEIDQQTSLTGDQATIETGGEYLDDDTDGEEDNNPTDRELLLRVDGIGPKKADTLLDEFGDLRGVSRKAGSHTASIARLDGFSSDTAQDLFYKMKDAGVYVGTYDSHPNDTNDEEEDDDGLIERLANEARNLYREATRPLPEDEQRAMYGGYHPDELKHTGLTPFDIESAPRDEQISDQRFEDRIAQEDDDPIVEDLAEKTAESETEGEPEAEPESNTDDTTEQDVIAPEADTSGTETVEVEFGNRSAANEAREDLPDGSQTDRYDRRHKTVEVFEGALSDDQIDRLVAHAADTKKAEAEKFGQEELTDSEVNRLKDRGGYEHPQKLFHAQSAKAILLGKGVDDWLSWYDPTLSTDEHREIAERARQEDVDDRLDEGDRAGVLDQQLADDHARVESQECDHAADHCEDGDPDACQFLKETCDWPAKRVETLRDGVEKLGENPEEVLGDPTPEDVIAPESAEFDRAAEELLDELPPVPDEPLIDLDDDVVDELSPDHDELPGEALGALNKAWTGYRMARTDIREARDEAVHYAEVINGIRMVHGQRPLSFESVDVFDSDPGPTPDDPDEAFPTAGGQRTIEEAGQQGLLSDFVDVAESAVQTTLGDVYDPTAEV